MASSPGPDSALVDHVLASPNHGERLGGRRPDMLVLHYTGMASGEAALGRLTDPSAEVSAHYVVLEDGRVVQLVAEERRAWHAGAGFWAGERDLNSCSIGIEIAHPGHAGGLPPYPAGQVAAVIRLARDIVERRAIPARRVLGHSDLAPLRKEDPGELFPWDALHAAGIGQWVPPVAITHGPALSPSDHGPAVERLQGELAIYGYACPATGIYDALTAAVVTAFQRHFRPERVDGLADRSTLETLRALLAAQPAS